MVSYLEGLILQAYEKITQIKGKFEPSELDGSFNQLSFITHTKLDSLAQEAIEILGDRRFQVDINQGERFERYQSLCRDIDLYENVVLAVLYRYKDDDAYMTALTNKICREIKYPFTPPTVSCLSQSYYCLYSEVNLICVPLLERHSLLHLPDFYHELGHPLIVNKNHPKAKKYQEYWAGFNKETRLHFDRQKRQITGSNHPELADYYEIWRKNWINPKGSSDWSTELFCDLFAVYTCGPAYVWSHFYLCTKTGNNPFEIPLFSLSEHPNDEARMRTMLLGLELLGLKETKEQIEQKWQNYLDCSSFSKLSYQNHAYPQMLLKQCATIAYSAIQSIDCLIYDQATIGTISKDLNDAWDTFWTSPSEFLEWEKEKIEAMQAKLFSKL